MPYSKESLPNCIDCGKKLSSLHATRCRACASIEKRKDKIQLFKQGLKKCPKCPEPKPLSEFDKDTNRVDGFACWCKEHEIEYNDKPEIKATTAKYQKEYREKNKVKLAKQKKEYTARPEVKDKITKRMKEWAKKNREKLLKKQKDYRDKPENKAKRNKRQRNRTKNDPIFHLTQSLRNRIRMALKRNSKSLNTMCLIGCDIDYLMYYIQEKFTEGMSWDNHGDWHMDHIKPCIKFDLSRKSEQLICFNFKNLQPLWAEENLRKADNF